MQNFVAAGFCRAETFCLLDPDGSIDIATKRLSAARLESLCFFLVFREERMGANDPDKIQTCHKSYW